MIYYSADGGHEPLPLSFQYAMQSGQKLCWDDAAQASALRVAHTLKLSPTVPSVAFPSRDSFILQGFGSSRSYLPRTSSPLGTKVKSDISDTANAFGNLIPSGNRRVEEGDFHIEVQLGLLEQEEGKPNISRGSTKANICLYIFGNALSHPKALRST